MLVVLNRRVLDPEAEASEKVVEVVAVLVLLGLAEDDEAAAGLDERFDRVDLAGLELGPAAVDGRLPLRLGGMGDDEHGGLASASLVSGPVVWAAVSNSRAESAAAARTREESAGWAGWIASATSARIVHASECDSSKSTRAALGGETMAF